MKLPLKAAAIAVATSAITLVCGGVSQAAITTAATTRAVMTSTFIQPSVNAKDPTINWTQAQYSQDFQRMTGAGIRSVVVQWTVDQDANQAYYPSSAGWYPQASNMVGTIMSAAQATNVSQVWLGLANTYDWQAHASDSSWLYNQLYADEKTADQLYALYGSKVTGWYVSDEVNDKLLSTSADVGPMTWFFSSLTSYLHSHDGDKPVMESPTYANLTESPAQFAASCQRVLGSLDVLNVQDSGGSGYEQPSDIKNWFTALHNQFSGSTTAIWDNPDLFSADGPIPSAQLQADLKATAGLVSSYSGFEFITQLDPTIVGTASNLNAYKSYAQTHTG